MPAGCWRTVLAVARAGLIERRMAKFLREPPSVRAAASTIVVLTASVVVIGGVLMRIFDHSEFSNVWVGMWWALQTATTVGYGDVTPAHVSGRVIAAFVMLEGIAFLAILTAAITSTFVARAAKEHDGPETRGELGKIAARLDDLDRKLDELHAALRERAS